MRTVSQFLPFSQRLHGLDGGVGTFSDSKATPLPQTRHCSQHSTFLTQGGKKNETIQCAPTRYTDSIEQDFLISEITLADIIRHFAIYLRLHPSLSGASMLLSIKRIVCKEAGDGCPMLNSVIFFCLGFFSNSVISALNSFAK